VTGRGYRLVYDSVLRHLDPEVAHVGALRAIGAAGRVPGASGARRALRVDAAALQVHALGLVFPGPLGIAAGFDKDAVAVGGLAALGFGFVEVGTVTAVAQPGNPRPRLARLPDDRALVNRMGFNNAGATALATRLRRLERRRSARSPRVVVGVNLGRSRSAPDAVADYVASATAVAPHADYLVVNVSSPNTPGLRDLQAVAELRPLLLAIRAAARGAAGRDVPLLVKVAPDLPDDGLLAVADLALDVELSGIVATNTTVARAGLRSRPAAVAAAGPGGLSGEPLAERSLQVLRLLRGRVGDRLVLVSAGGIQTAEDAWQRLRAGATLVQAYTAFVYEGPLWPSRVQRGLLARAWHAGYPSVQDAVGRAVAGPQEDA
jgi:dihydroorotate dehydrogenase